MQDGSCDMLYETCCPLAGGVVELGQTCQGDAACCLPNGTCQNADALCCELELGGLAIPGALCTSDQKCCLPDGTCDFMDPLCCQALGGVSSSGPPPCAQVGCCMPDGSCIDTDPECCQQFGGTVQATLCEPAEACCIMPTAANPLGCLDTAPQCCNAAGGTPQGPGSACTGVDGNGDGVDDACTRCQDPCVDCNDFDACTCDKCENGFCVFPQRLYGDVDCNNVINIFDLFCILDAFGGTFSSCCFSNADIEPCAGNGVINIFDLFGILAAFGGGNPCNCVAGPIAPPPPAAIPSSATVTPELRADRPERAAQASILIVPKSTEVTAGGEMLVDVYAVGAQGLRGYEVKLSATGGSRGKLSVENVAVDEGRKDYAFIGRNGYTATDQGAGRTAGLLWDGAVPVAQRAYLGTFTLRPSRDARGQFTLSVDVGTDTFLIDSAGRELPVRRPASIAVTVR